MITRRRALQGISAAGGAVLAARHGLAAVPDLTTVTIRASAMRGMEQTMLEGTGQLPTQYRLQFAEFNAGNLVTQAINADALDLGGWSEIPLVFAAAAHANIRVVGVMEGPTSNQAVMVPTHSSVRSIADLRGKRVGYIRATTSHYFLLKMLAQHGMSFQDIQPVALGVSTGLTAMKSGSLDAWATFGYGIATLQAEGAARELQNAVGILSGNYFVGANPRTLQSQAFRAAAVDYIGRLQKAFTILDADKPRWVRLVAPVVSVPEPIVLAYLSDEDKPWRMRAIRSSDITSAQNVADTFTQAGLLPPAVNVARISAMSWDRH